MQKQVEKVVKKRINLGTHTLSTHTYSHTFVFNSTNSTAKLESQVHKDIALQWYRRWASFKNTSPNMTYAQAAKNNRAKNCHINRDRNAMLASPPKKHYLRNPLKHPVHVNTATDKSACSANKTKVLRNEKNVPVALFNRFQILDTLPDDHNTCTSQSISRDSSVYSIELKDGHASKRSFQHSWECKHPSSLGTSQPLLAAQENSYCQGNKNKTGFFVGDNMHTKTKSDNFTVPNLSDLHVTSCETSQVVKDSPNISQDLGIIYQPQLAEFEHSFLGNKNKTGYFDGDIKNANDLQDLNAMYENHGDVIDVMDTKNLQQVSDQNCSRNSANDSSHVHYLPYDTVDTSESQTFGFIPKGTLKLYDGDPGVCNSIPDIITAHLLVKQSGYPNFLGCRIPVVSNLKCENWSFYLKQYWDKQLPDLLKFGFPLDFDRNCFLDATEVNHKSALLNAYHVDNYIAEELRHQAILGPFDTKPINLHTSPLMVRDKQDSDSKRTIMDLSWPEGHSVNFGVSKDRYLGTEFILKYPSIDTITSSLKKLGPAAMIYKIDISRAFRQIKVDPGDIDLLGFKVNNQYFLDLSVAFGYRNGSQIFQRCTDAIRYIMSQHGFHNLHNYIDDLIYTGLPSEIHASYAFLKHLLAQLGLDISMKKLVPPSTVVTCLGIQIDTVKRTLSIPEGKLQEIINLCKNWVSKTYCSKKDLQSLLGSLLYITKCVAPARAFLNRMLLLLRQNTHVSKILLTQDFFHDLAWFNNFLQVYNGVTFYDQVPSNIEVHLDACLTGLGGHFGNMIYTLPIPLGFQQYDITQLEMINIVVAAKIWASHWSNKKIRIYSDNMAVVQVLTTGKARDQMLATCARNIWLIAAINNIQFQFSHIPGKNNNLADLLSRWHIIHNRLDKLHSLISNYVWIPTHLTLTHLNTSI